MALVGADIPYGDFYEIYNDIFSLNPPVVDVLARVKAAGYKTLLLSNTDPERFGFVRRRFPEILFFDDYVLSYELKLLKPDPAIYLAAARLAGCAPRRMRLHRRHGRERQGRRRGGPRRDPSIGRRRTWRRSSRSWGSL